MARTRKSGPIKTIYGEFMRDAKHRLDMTYDYESAEILAFRKIADLLQPALLLDIGANIGVYAVFVSAVPSLRRILAFEPAPEAFALLERNLALQSDSRFSCYNEALSDQAGFARFAIFGAMAGNNAIEGTATTSPTDSSQIIEVPTSRLDDRIPTRNETFMAKLDVEGHELQVLDGAKTFLAQNTGVLQIEAFDRIGVLDCRMKELGYARVFRMKNDYYYANIPDMELRERICDILFAETAQALTDLKDERRRRRLALRACRDVLKTLDHTQDPVLIK
jgi:FkbM family methyltransferase